MLLQNSGSVIVPAYLSVLYVLDKNVVSHFLDWSIVIYSFVLVSGIQQNDSVIYVCVYVCIYVYV